MCNQHGHPAGGHVHHREHGSLFGHRARPDDFRLVVTGKGGVGKTTLTALVSLALARRGLRVLALDADPQMNLPWALDLSPDAISGLVPLSENADYIEETTGARPGAGWGLFFRLNPRVDDVVERFGLIAPCGVRLLVMGNTVQPAAGCLCPENALLAAVVDAIAMRSDEAILMDTQAGFEHFGRALAKGFRHALVVTDTTFNGVQAALHAARLAQDSDIGAVHLIVNGVRTPSDFERVETRIAAGGAFEFASCTAFPYDEGLRRAEPSVTGAIGGGDSPLERAVDELLSALIPIETGALSCAS